MVLYIIAPHYGKRYIKYECDRRWLHSVGNVKWVGKKVGGARGRYFRKRGDEIEHRGFWIISSFRDEIGDLFGGLGSCGYSAVS